jgi:membrane associated rhomboid family serine protease
MFPLYDLNPTLRWPVVNLAIIALNVVLTVWTTTMPESRYNDIVAHYGFVPHRLAQLSDPTLLVQVPIGTEDNPQTVTLAPAPKQIYLSLLTCMFLHAGWLHVLGNVWFLFIFGDNVEDRLGHLPYLAFYLLGGLAASLVQWVTDPVSDGPVIGASGAIAAVLGAYAVTFPWVRVRTLIFIVFYVTFVELPALVVLGIWLAVQLLDGLGTLRLHTSGGVAFWAHVGGFAFGAALMPLLCAILPPPKPPVPSETEPASPPF